jgi:hypothetical protein
MKVTNYCKIIDRVSVVLNRVSRPGDDKQRGAGKLKNRSQWLLL